MTSPCQQPCTLCAVGPPTFTVPRVESKIQTSAIRTRQRTADACHITVGTRSALRSAAVARNEWPAVRAAMIRRTCWVCPHRFECGECVRLEVRHELNRTSKVVNVEPSSPAVCGVLGDVEQGGKAKRRTG
jgi:hypothetical protein